MCLTCTSSLNGCIFQSFLLFHPGKFHSQCKIQTASGSKKWVIYASTIYIWVYNISSTLGPAIFLGFSLTLFFFFLLIMFIVWMCHVHAIKFTIHLVIGSPPILAIYSNIVIWFLDAPGLKIRNFLNLNLVRVTSFSVIAGVGSVSSSSLEFYKDINFVFL